MQAWTKYILRNKGHSDLFVYALHKKWGAGYPTKQTHDFLYFAFFLLRLSLLFLIDSRDLSTHFHDDVFKWKYFPHYWPFLRGIHRSPVKSPHKGQWRGALKFSLICFGLNGWINNRKAGDMRRYRAHYDVTMMSPGWVLPSVSEAILKDILRFGRFPTDEFMKSPRPGQYGRHSGRRHFQMHFVEWKL